MATEQLGSQKQRKISQKEGTKPLSSIPKKDGGHRLILNLAKLN